MIEWVDSNGLDERRHAVGVDKKRRKDGHSTTAPIVLWRILTSAAVQVKISISGMSLVRKALILYDTRFFLWTRRRHRRCVVLTLRRAVGQGVEIMRRALSKRVLLVSRVESMPAKQWFHCDTVVLILKSLAR